MENEIVSQVTSAAIVVYAIQTMKASKFFSFISAETPTINRLAASVGALVSAVGVHAAFDVSGGVLTITGLTVSGILHSAWHFANQYALQQLAYDAVTKKEPPPARIERSA